MTIFFIPQYSQEEDLNNGTISSKIGPRVPSGLILKDITFLSKICCCSFVVRFNSIIVKKYNFVSLTHEIKIKTFQQSKFYKCKRIRRIVTWRPFVLRQKGNVKLDDVIRVDIDIAVKILKILKPEKTRKFVIPVLEDFLRLTISI